MAEITEFNQKNNRYPLNAQEFLNYLAIKNPVFVSSASAFRLKNYAYSYRLLDGGHTAVLWAVPSPKEAQVPPSDADNYQNIETLRGKLSAQSPAYFTVIAPKLTRRFQGQLTAQLSDIDRLPDEPSANQLNSVGLFEKASH